MGLLSRVPHGRQTRLMHSPPHAGSTTVLSLQMKTPRVRVGRPTVQSLPHIKCESQFPLVGRSWDLGSGPPGASAP